MEKRRPIGGRGAYGCGLDLHRLLRHRSAGAGHPRPLSCAGTCLGPTPDEFVALPILTAVFYPVTLGFLFMAIVGMKKLSYFGRLRKLLRAANDLDLRPAIPGPQGPN